MYLLELAAFEIKASADIFAMDGCRDVRTSRSQSVAANEQKKNVRKTKTRKAGRQAAARGALVPKYAPYLGLAGDFPSADLQGPPGQARVRTYIP